ncbi:myb domain protein 4, partial [Prunus dulcis]
MSEWSLIARRLPGRTANNVKNYWNTRSRTDYCMKKMKDKAQETIKTTIRPQPRRFTKSSNCLSFKEPILDHTNVIGGRPFLMTRMLLKELQ